MDETVLQGELFSSLSLMYAHDCSRADWRACCVEGLGIGIVADIIAK